jgi:hypothetical protein
MPPKVNKTEVELRKLTKLEGNKTCADCPEKVTNHCIQNGLCKPLIFGNCCYVQMPGYADLSNRVFVCTKCAGIQ